MCPTAWPSSLRATLRWIGHRNVGRAGRFAVGVPALIQKKDLPWVSCADRFRNSSTCGCRANGQRALGTRRRACGAADRSPRSGPRSLVCPRHRGHGAQRRTPSCPLRSVRRGRAPWPGNRHLPASLPELDARVFFHLEVDVRLAIAGEELANPQGRRGMGRSDQDSVASVVGDQRHPAEDERAQEDLAQLGIGLDHPPQRVRRHLRGLPSSRIRPRTRVRRPVRMLDSPVNSPGAWTVVGSSRPSTRWTISILPEMTTWKLREV